MFFFKLRARPWKAWWKWTSLEYESVVYPSTQDTGSLRDTRYEEFAFFPGPVPDWTDMPKVRSLRASFARMLLDPAFEDDDFIIFGESDSTLPLRRPYCAKPWKKNSCAIRKRTYCAHFWNWPPGRLSAHLPGTSAF